MTLTARISNSLAAMTMIVVRNARRVTMTSTVQSGNVACKRNPLPSYIYHEHVIYVLLCFLLFFPPLCILRCGLYICSRYPSSDSNKVWCKIAVFETAHSLGRVGAEKQLRRLDLNGARPVARREAVVLLFCDKRQRSSTFEVSRMEYLYKIRESGYSS